MTAAVRVRGLSWTPLGQREPVLDGVDLTIAEGERVLVTGPSGGGKSTLLRALAGLLGTTTGGDLRGDVQVAGRAAHPGDVALLTQDPRDARVAERAGRDVAFACENAGMPRAVIAERVAWALDAVGFRYGQDHLTTALSGGEAQRLALAGVIAGRAPLVLLDEPTSMLDPASAAAVRGAVKNVLDELHATLVVVEHRLDGWLPLVDRLVVMDAQGRVVADGAPDAVLATHAATLLAHGVWVPGAPAPRPLDVPDELLDGLVELGGDPGGAGPLLQADGLGLVRAAPRRLLNARRRDSTTALTDVDATVGAGRYLALRGASGAGKSSLLDLLTGLTAPTTGRVVAAPALATDAGASPHTWSSRQLAARIGWVPQEAAATVVGATVDESLTATVRALGADERAIRRARDLADILGLTGALARNPHRLSGGETRRLAVASALAHGPGLLALDEPTVGQDRHTWSAVAGLTLAARRRNRGVVAATHDDVFADLADDTLHLADGRVVA